MKDRIKISLCTFFLLLSLFSCSKEDSEINTGIDVSQLKEEVSPNGGSYKIGIASNGKWAVVTDATWIKVSPLNGEGPSECIVQVDSTVLADKVRSALIQVVSDDQTKPLEFVVHQKGYEKSITINNTSIELPSYGEYGKQKFQVEVTTNVPFEVKFSGTRPWLSCASVDMEALLNRGGRPRTFTLDFTWETNTRPEDRELEVYLEPTIEGTLAQHDQLYVHQLGAEKIEPGVTGDSLAILACVRSLNCSWNVSSGEKMRNWPEVVLWNVSDKEVIEKPELLDRVRSVVFRSSRTEVGIPFEIQYLTAAEEISFYSNVSGLIRNLPSGSDISKLTQLKRLQIYAFGLVEIDPSLKNLKNLEALDISGNNLDQIPSILTPENFPKLTHLNIGGNRRYASPGNLNLPIRPKDQWGGLYKSTTPSNSNALKTLLKWEKLEYLRMTNNIFQYSLPDMLNDGLPVYKKGDQYKYRWDGVKGEWIMHDIPDYMIGKPKVLPNATTFAIGLNYFTGKLPDWVLYHPHLLLWWDPTALIFNQEKKYVDEKGNPVGFTNVPETPNYYYVVYPEQKPE